MEHLKQIIMSVVLALKALVPAFKDSKTEAPKETIEALKGFLVLAAAMAEIFKDGVQTQDVSAVLAKLQDPVLAEKMKLAYNGIELVPAELKQAHALEYLALMAEVTPELQTLIDAVKKPKA